VPIFYKSAAAENDERSASGRIRLGWHRHSNFDILCITENMIYQLNDYIQNNILLLQQILYQKII